MNRVGQFEKVSFEQFYKSVNDLLENGCLIRPSHKDGKQDLLSEMLQVYDKIELPHRATRDSAGYDLQSTLEFSLFPGGSQLVPTGIRVKIERGWFLSCYPRSGLGFKYRLQLDNTVGVIDGDYYYSDNEGHIFLKLTNDSKDGKAVAINTGDKIAQCIFMPYGIAYDDCVKGTRNGGFGSTDT